LLATFFEGEFDKPMQIIEEGGLETIELWPTHPDYLEATWEKTQCWDQLWKMRILS